LGGASLFIIFGFIYLWESFFGGDIDLSPATSAVAAAASSLNEQAKGGFPSPEAFPGQQDFVEKLTRSLHIAN
jgi:hypothetical protein